jgi:SNF2 family DNA or RNA helicase
MLDLIESMLIQEGVPALRFDGRVKPELREKIKILFGEDPKYRVILVSFKAGGVGINMLLLF